MPTIIFKMKHFSKIFLFTANLFFFCLFHQAIASNSTVCSLNSDVFDVEACLIKKSWDERIKFTWQASQEPEIYMPILLKLLDSKNQEIRQVAIEALKEIGPPPQEAIPKLKRELSSTNDEYCLLIVETLGMIGVSALPVLTEILNDERDELRASAVMQLGIIGPDAKQAIPKLKSLLGDKNELVRIKAATALLSISQKNNNEAIDILKKAICNKNKKISFYTIESLTFSRYMPREFIPLLSSKLSSSEQQERGVIYMALASADSEAEQVIPLLLSALRREQDSFFLVIAFVRLGKKSVPAMVKLLQNNEEDNIKVAAIKVLQKIGPDAKAAVPVLANLIQNEELAFPICEALGDICDESCIHFLINAAQQGSWRIQAIKALGCICSNTELAIPFLKKITKDENEKLRKEALHTLKKLRSRENCKQQEEHESMKERGVSRPVLR